MIPTHRAAISALLLVCAIVSTATAQTTPDEAVIGLWVYEWSFPLGPAGELTVTRRGSVWQGSIAGATAEATARGKELRIVLTNEGDMFRGQLDADGRLERCFWVRHEILDDPRYPEGAAQAYAMPLAIRSAGTDRWHATVKPLPDSFTLYLNIFRDDGGVLKAAIRNPDQNYYGPAMQMFATVEGNRLRLGKDASLGENDMKATVAHDPERIELYWQGLRRVISMTRATAAQASLFTARPRAEPPYVYRKPAQTVDGWSTARASDLGVDEEALAKAVQRIIDIDPSAPRPWLIHSMAIAYKGKLILDEYFYGNERDVPHDMRSASKTFSSVILGAAMMEGAKISPSTRLYEVVSPLGPFSNPDPRKDRITLGNVMAHTTGLACDDNAESPSPGGEDVMESQRAQLNWWKFTLDLPIVHEPGERYAYCSGGISLTGAALTMATGEWLPAIFDRTIAEPLQFGSYYWNLMPNGEGYLGGGAFVRTRDFLKIGQAYLDGGVWNGRRVATEAWVKDAWAPHAHISEETTGVTGEAFANAYYDVDEGYAWHHITVKSGDRKYPAYHGNGNGGQLLLVVPQFDLVAMFTGGNYRQGLWNRERDDILGEMIIPALNRESGPRH